jgi:predicted nucleic acid-binding protein
MKGILVDASFSASWFLDDEWHESSAEVLDQMQSGTSVFVPNLWLLEITNLLFVAQRRGRIDRKYRDEAFARISRLALNVFAAPTFADMTTLRHFSEKYQLTAYDAEYLRVAMEQGLVLASFDRQLTAAAKREKVQVIGAD